MSCIMMMILIIVVSLLIIVIDVEFDNEFLSGLIIKIEHIGEILTSFLARSI